MQAAPASWADVAASRRQVVLWWDEPCPWAGPVAVDLESAACLQGRVEAQRPGSTRWRAVGKAARPGWTSRPLPSGTRFRVRLDGAVRWSEPVRAPDVVTPVALSRLERSGGGAIGWRVGQIAVDGRGGVVASTLGGGLLAVDPGGQVRTWSQLEGLPDDQVVAVDARDGAVLVGAGAGAALLQDGRVVAVWSDELAGRWTQAVHLGRDALWLGSPMGLTRVRGAAVEAAEGPAVWSVSPARGGGVWVGQGGLQLLPPGTGPLDAAGAAGIPTPGKVYDVLDLGEQVWVAVADKGLYLADPHGPDGRGALVSMGPESPAYALAPGGAAPQVAAGAAGVWTVSADGERQGGQTEAAGGPVWALAASGGGLWVGGDGGIVRMVNGAVSWRAQPAAPAAGAPVDALAVGPGGLAGTGPSGAWTVGPRPPASTPAPVAVDAAALGLPAPGSVTALLRSGAEVWWTDGAAIWRRRPDGGVDAFLQTRAPHALALAPGGVWVASQRGLERLAAGAGAVDDPVAGGGPRRPATAVAAHADGGCFVGYAADPDSGAPPQIGRLHPDGRLVLVPLPVADAPDPTSLGVDPRDDDAVWVGTAIGVYRVRVPARAR